MKKYCLVKWTDGEDEGKFSVVDTSDIIGFTEEDAEIVQNVLMSHDTCINIEDLSTRLVFMVRWRRGRKPENGWPSFEGEILTLSDNQARLEKFLEFDKNDPEEPLGKRGHHPKRRFPIEEEDLSEKSATKEKGKGKQVKKQKVQRVKEYQKELLAKYSSDACKDTPAGDVTSECQRCLLLVSENKQLQAENQKLKDTILKDVPQLISSVKELVAQRSPRPSSVENLPTIFKARENLDFTFASQSETGADLKRSPSCIEKQPTLFKAREILDLTFSSQSDKDFGSSLESGNDVELGKGSGIFVNALAWVDAKQQATFGRMAVSLLMAIFPLSVLLKSNLRGGCSKNTNENRAFQALDSTKLSAIYKVVQTKFPAMTRSHFGQAINNKLSALRFCNKRT